ncbi:hypothetical protein HanRHA438_Chr11g0507771 [Helianthus annuus]|nr:hypothetical protein HanHA300_Chr11g0406041 [Helianthus annuus]KAJ0517793.1 hypothetical protein HanHA89_Chr11g0429781 [Helianthus annuus]KAJ0685810.1 hypothetical protein HanLR1_Chr11g0407281 [Helianthus annuus]KAJ0689680.1 hypothetical protein HanOQP8_Chr11g0408861 [Helianthus annuus]KAJ0871051.1 hypothetical protein HanRHA438_Chr11g0507771 [Helianthus annuus]
MVSAQVGFGSVNHGSAVRDMVQFWFSQNWSKLGQCGQYQVNGLVSGFRFSQFGSTAVWVKFRVRSTVLVDSVKLSQLSQLSRSTQSNVSRRKI